MATGGQGTVGSKFLIYVDTNVGTDNDPNYQDILYQQEFSKSDDLNLIDAHYKQKHPAPNRIVGQESGSTSVSALYSPYDEDSPAYDALVTSYKEGHPVIIRVTFDGTTVLEAPHFVESLPKEWPNNEAATVDMEFSKQGRWVRLDEISQANAESLSGSESTTS